MDSFASYAIQCDSNQNDSEEIEYLKKELQGLKEETMNGLMSNQPFDRH